MDSGQTLRVFDDQGYIGVLVSPKRMEPGSAKSIRLEDGREIQVSAEDLKARPDGSFYLRRAVSKPAEPPPPPPAEPQTAAAPAPDGIGGEFFEQNYHIERVAVGRILDSPATQRQEGDTLILPVVEEVIVCEKKMVLKEEVRITMKRQPLKEVRRIPAESFGGRAS